MHEEGDSKAKEDRETHVMIPAKLGRVAEPFKEGYL